MKLFKIMDPNGGGYDRFNGAVVIAPDEDSARHMHPQIDAEEREYWSTKLGWVKPWDALKINHLETLNYSIRGGLSDLEEVGEIEEFWRDWDGVSWTTGMSYWPNPSAVTVEYLGESNEEHPRVVLADFHHG